MLKLKKVCFLFVGLFALSSFNLSAQRTTSYTEAEKAFKDGLELYQKNMFAAAQTKFVELSSNSHFSISRQTRADADYYNAACAYELTHNNARALLNTFIRKYPESPMVSRAYLKLGLLEFRERKWKNSINAFDEADLKQLSKAENFELKYKKGYSLYMLDEFDQSLVYLAEVKDADNQYEVPATYYYAHICYLQKKWENALDNFKRIDKEKSFSGLIPYYITQIYYFQKKYDKVIDYAKPLADTSASKYSGQILRILAESYFNKQRFDEAAASYGKYLAKGNNLDREGVYRYGLSFYNGKKYVEAARQLNEVCTEDDSLSQNAYYFIADCYMNLNDKKKARDAFKQAYKTNGSRVVREDALFNFAKLSYDIDYDPYNEAITAMKDYLEEYPNSPRRDALYEYLAEIYMTTKHYKDALENLEKIVKKSLRYREAYQRVAYLRGLELFNMGDYKNAIKHFNLTEKDNVNKVLFANSVYWTAESFYRLKQYDESEEAYEEFIITPGAIETGRLVDAYYNLGYIHYRDKDYVKASVEFRKYADNAKNLKKKADALMRIGDCFYAQKDMNRALGFYNQAIEIAKYDMDYALLQKAIILGINGNHQEKIASLSRILSDYPQSPYKAEVLYETGNTQMRINENDAAAKNFQTVISDYPASAFTKKAYLKLGLIYFNREDDKQALAAYKKVLELYPGTPESQEALKYVRSIYVDEGNIDGFTEFIASVKGVDISTSALDSSSYQSAENQMLKGDCFKASQGFDKYLQKFPNGTFSLNAKYYRAECKFINKDDEAALKDFEDVIAFGPSNFYENALLKSGEIYTEQKNYPEMKRIFGLLETTTDLKENKELAQRSNMLASYMLKNYQDALKYAAIVLAFEKTNEALSQFALYVSAKSEMQLGNREGAMVHFKKLAQYSGNEYTAEAKYMLCEDLYEKGDYAGCEKKIMASINALNPFPNWLAKLFILLAENYVKQDNIFQAKATLQSVIDNHDGADLVNLAKSKLNAIIEAEKSKQKSSAQPGNEIEPNQN